MIVIYIVLILTALVGLWLLMLRTKRKKADFFGLAKYHYAHRGLHGNGVPENSMAAFRMAVERGYGAELDVHLTKDRQLIVFHDETLERIAGVQRKVEECTYEELQAYRLEGTKEQIPRLQEVLSLFEGKTPLIIEIKALKDNYAELTRRVCEMLVNFPKLQFCMESFDPRVVRWLKKHRPEIIRGQLSRNFIRNRKHLPLLPAVLLSGLVLNFLTVPHFVAYRFEDRQRLSLRICRSVWGVQEVSWTIRNKADAKTALDDGALIIFENFEP